MAYPLKQHKQAGKDSNGYIKTYCGQTLRNIGDILRKCNSANETCELCARLERGKA